MQVVSLDGFEIKQYKLMPMSGGDLFTGAGRDPEKDPQAGRRHGRSFSMMTAHIDQEVPEELAALLEDELKAKKFFDSLPTARTALHPLDLSSAKKEERV